MATTSESCPTDPETGGATPAALLELGELLTSEMEDTDTLGRWMAHYLAQRMAALPKVTGSEVGIAEAEVGDLILRLWALRREFPRGRVPLAEVDEVEAAIARLAPGRRPWAYFGAFAADTEPNAEATEASSILKAALLLDRLAGDLVHGLVGYAAALAEGDEAAWVKHAEQIGDETLQRVRRIRLDEGDGEDAIVSDKWSREVKTRGTALLAVVSTLVAALEAGGSDSPQPGPE